MARSCYWLEWHRTNLVTDLTRTLFVKRKKGNDRTSTFLFPPIQEIGQELCCLWWGRMTWLCAGWKSFTSFTSCFGYFAYNINDTYINSLRLIITYSFWALTEFPMPNDGYRRSSEVVNVPLRSLSGSTLYPAIVSKNLMKEAESISVTVPAFSVLPNYSPTTLQRKYKMSSKKYIYSPCYLILISLILHWMYWWSHGLLR